MDDVVVWEPSAQRIASSHLRRFMAVAPGSPETYDELWSWSIDDRDAFWRLVWDYGGVVAETPPDQALGRDGMPGAEWFPGARLNFAENLLRRDDTGVAVVVADERGAYRELTWRDLRAEVARAQRGLEALGVGVGDRVAALVTNGIEALVGMLATTAIGAVWSSCSPDFGPTGVVDRFGQIEPRVLLTVVGYRYGGRHFDVSDTVAATLDAVPQIESVIVVGDGSLDTDLAEVTTWDTLLDHDVDEPTFTRLPFSHPIYILYSSGTTGPPKSIVHGAGGTLLKHLCEHQLHSDVHADDRVFWFTTCGWMMWNWLVSALASGAATVLYDGSPTHPDLGALWRLAERAGITLFGTSPRFLAANANAGLTPSSEADLSSIRTIASTGAPLNPEQFDWVYENVASDVHLASISGGTDIVGCFAAGVPILPVRRGQLQARALGMAIESHDSTGAERIGVKGELVCTRSFPSMPVSFWNDPDGSRYRAAYFSDRPGVWTHGDFIEIRPEGGVIIYGRSDTTLNPGGVRIGTAEIYRAIEPMPEVDDAIVIGVPSDGDVEVVLFVRLTEGHELDDDLRQRIASTIRSEASPRHVPGRMLTIADIPYTLSGKKVEKAVRNVVLGEEVTNRDALANPEALDLYVGVL